MADEKIHGIPFDAQEILTSTGELTYDHVYFASDLAKWLGTYFSNGVLVPGGAIISTELQVTKTSIDSITVNTGAMVINGRTFFLEAPETFILNGTTAGNTRIDRVIVELNLTDSINSFRLLISTGVEGTAPSPQELVRDENVLKTYQMSLAQVSVDINGIVSITDERVDPVLCGISQVLIGVRNPLPVTGDTASNISYDNTVSGLLGNTVQLAIDELVPKEYEITLEPNGWNADNVQTLTVQGITVLDTPIVDVIPSTRDDSSLWGAVWKVETGANFIRFYASKPINSKLKVKVKVI